MTETVEGGATLAWRLLATLEGGSLLLATSALLMYTARVKHIEKRRRRTIRNVLISNTTNTLGNELKTRVLSRGCTVSTIPKETSATWSDTNRGTFDALVIIGSEMRQNSLEGISTSVTEDVHNNLKLLQDLSPLVERGGCIAWASVGSVNGAYSSAGTAFDTVLRSSLQHNAKRCHCDPIWIDRSEDVHVVVERIVVSLFHSSSQENVNRFSIRNITQRLSKNLGRWLKIVK